MCFTHPPCILQTCLSCFIQCRPFPCVCYESSIDPHQQSPKYLDLSFFIFIPSFPPLPPPGLCYRSPLRAHQVGGGPIFTLWSNCPPPHLLVFLLQISSQSSMSGGGYLYSVVQLPPHPTSLFFCYRSQSSMRGGLSLFCGPTAPTPPVCSLVIDLLSELNEWGPIFTLWSNSEDKLSQALSAVAKSVEKCYSALQELVSSRTPS